MSSPYNLNFRDRSLFKCLEGPAKKEGVGGHTNFHVASKGVNLNLGLPVRE